MARQSQISIKSPAEQALMRAAGRLAADVLDMIGEHVRPGASTDDLDRHLPRLHRRGQPGPFPRPSTTAAARPPALPQVDLHLGQPRRLPRHSGRPAAQGRRHRQRRRHGHQGRLPRRHEPDVPGRQVLGAGRAAVPGGLRGHVAGIRRRSGRAPVSATSATPSRPRRGRRATRWCANTAATASAASSTRTRRSCTTASPAPADPARPA
jgi:hypothetical protein